MLKDSNFRQCGLDLIGSG